MQPSVSLPGTFEADDVNSMQLHTTPPASRATQAAGWWVPGGIPVWEGGFFAPRILGQTFGFALLPTESIGAKNGFA